MTLSEALELLGLKNDLEKKRLDYSRSELKKAYHEKIKQYHPDRMAYNEDANEEKLKDVNAAYDFLNEVLNNFNYITYTSNVINTLSDAYLSNLPYNELSEKEKKISNTIGNLKAFSKNIDDPFNFDVMYKNIKREIERIIFSLKRESVNILDAYNIDNESVNIYGSILVELNNNSTNIPIITGIKKNGVKKLQSYIMENNKFFEFKEQIIPKIKRNYLGNINIQNIHNSNFLKNIQNIENIINIYSQKIELSNDMNEIETNIEKLVSSIEKEKNQLVNKLCTSIRGGTILDKIPSAKKIYDKKIGDILYSNSLENIISAYDSIKEEINEEIKSQLIFNLNERFMSFVNINNFMFFKDKLRSEVNRLTNEIINSFRYDNIFGYFDINYYNDDLEITKNSISKKYDAMLKEKDILLNKITKMETTGELNKLIHRLENTKDYDSLEKLLESLDNLMDDLINYDKKKKAEKIDAMLSMKFMTLSTDEKIRYKGVYTGGLTALRSYLHGKIEIDIEPLKKIEFKNLKHDNNILRNVMFSREISKEELAMKKFIEELSNREKKDKTSDNFSYEKRQNTQKPKKDEFGIPNGDIEFFELFSDSPRSGR